MSSINSGSYNKVTVLSSNIGSPRFAPIRARGIEQYGRFVSTGGVVDNQVTDLLNGIFEQAVLTGVSDVHFEFDELDGMVARGRSEGDLGILDYRLEADGAKLAKTKLCAKSQLDDQERLIPQDGRMMIFFGERRVDIRVAITPTVTGFKIVCRLLDSSNSDTNIDKLEMPFLVKQAMKRVAVSPEGMILMCGPTGSGKTTTLYAMLRYLNEPTRHIITIENPVEYVIKQFTQIDVDANLTFPKAMRSSLRLDPDIIMVGEIRDDESASIGVKAGTSGHMVMSTIHTNSAAEIVTRLLSFGLKPFEISSVLSAMIAQRLVKRISPDAMIEWLPPDDIEREWLMKRHIYADSQLFPRIDQNGFSGRVPMVEMIEMTQEMRTMMDETDVDSGWIAKIVEIAVKQPQFETLAQAGVRLALEGKTTMAEVMRSTSDIGYIPSSRRFEQLLIYEGLLSLDVLENAHREIAEAREQGRIISLENLLVDQKICSGADVAAAIQAASHAIVD